MDSTFITNTEIFGIPSAIRVSKYPMSVDVSKVNSEITHRQISLGHAEKGSGHDSYLKGILVKMDVTGTIKFWIEMGRYHFSDIASSQSTMHRISKMKIADCCIKYTSKAAIEETQRLVDEYNKNPTEENFLTLIYSFPVGLRLTAGMVTNYLEIKNQYYQRKNHRLPEWKWFCEWAEQLPYFDTLVLCDTTEVVI